MGQAQRFAKTFLLLAVATLFFRYGVVWLFKPFEIFIAAASVAAFLDRPPALMRFGKPWLTIFIAALLFMLAGSAIGYASYGAMIGTDARVKIIGGFFYFAIDVAAFLLALAYGVEPVFRKKLLVAFLSPLVFLPFIIFPANAIQFGMTSDAVHFQGFHDNPITFAFLAFFALAVLIGIYYETRSRIKKFLLWLAMVGNIGLIIWTGSRSSWISIAASTAWLVVYFLFIRRSVVHRSFRIKIRKTIAALALILSASIIGFLIMPRAVEIMALDRLYPQISNYLPSLDKLRNTSLWSALQTASRAAPSFPYQSRQLLWPQAVGLILRHPMGLGVEYFRYVPKIQQNGIPTNSHNTALQAGLVGGIGLLLVYGFAIVRSLRELFRGTKDEEWLILSMMAIGGFLFSLIGEYLYIIPWLWIMGGLIAAKAAQGVAE